MAKSKGNVISPDPMVAEYGADTVRLYTLFMGPPDQDAEWFQGGVAGRYRFLARLWRLVLESVAETGPGIPAHPGPSGGDQALLRKSHWAIDKVTRDIGDRFAFNTAQSAVQELVNLVHESAEADAETRRFALATAVSLIHPYAPHIACELWSRMGGERLWQVSWPVADPELLVADTTTYAVQVNGRLRGEVAVDTGTAQESVLAAAREHPNVRAHIDGKQVVKEIVVPDRLVNLVVR
jgi:leucyl-tRNA synthetase